MFVKKCVYSEKKSKKIYKNFFSILLTPIGVGIADKEIRGNLMIVNTTSLTTVYYSIEMIRDEVRQLVDRGIVTRHQPIYVLCKYIPAREWVEIELELERHEYLLRDRLGDLICNER
jgi:uncharacterized protein YqgQ